MFRGEDKNRTIFRSLYYPTLTDKDAQPGVVRCGAHSDYGSITLLLQDDMGGLELLYIFIKSCTLIANLSNVLQGLVQR